MNVLETCGPFLPQRHRDTEECTDECTEKCSCDVKISFSMAELQSLTPEILLHIANTLQVSLKSLVATLELLDEGSTVPFIARYRKEATGNLDEVQIRAIEEKLAYFRELIA